MVVRKVGIQTNGTIFYKSVQHLAYADDIDIIARSRAALKEALGCLIDANNGISAEIKKKILLDNKGFYGPKRQFRSQFLSIKNKVKLYMYKTLIRPVPAYGSETWVISKSDKAILGVFERKILRAVFSPTNDHGEWRIKYNNELYALYKESDIITYNKIICLMWAGHVI
jgi:hypothetical protein